MNKAFRKGSVLRIAVSIISLLSAVGLLYLMLQEKNKRIETEEELAKTERAKRTVEIKLDHAQLELIQLKDRSKILESKLEEEEKKYAKAVSEIEEKDSQIKELENSLSNEKRQRTSLADKLAQLKEDHTSLEERLKEARLKIEDFRSRLEKYEGKGGVELKKIVVKPQKKLAGKVLIVNREFHFVVINLGKKDDVDIGDEFTVYRGSDEIGKVRVEKVYDSMSTAAILPGSEEQKITEDSIVKTF